MVKKRDQNKEGKVDKNDIDVLGPSDDVMDVEDDEGTNIHHTWYISLDAHLDQAYLRALYYNFGKFQIFAFEWLTTELQER